MKKKLSLFCALLFATLLPLQAAPATGGQPQQQPAVAAAAVQSAQLEELSQHIARLQETIDSQEAQMEAMQQQVDSAKDSAQLPLLLAFVALAVAAVALVLCVRKPRQKKPSAPDPHDEAGEKREHYLLNQLRQQEEQLQALGKRLEAFEAVLRKLKEQPGGAGTAQQGGSQSSGGRRAAAGGAAAQASGREQAPSFQRQEKFAEAIDGNAVRVSDLVDANSSYAMLRISIDSPTTATFQVNDLPEAQGMLVSSYKYTIAGFVNRLSASMAPSRIITQKPGRLSLQGDRWVLAQKADIVME